MDQAPPTNKWDIKFTDIMPRKSEIWFLFVKFIRQIKKILLNLLFQIARNRFHLESIFIACLRIKKPAEIQMILPNSAIIPALS